MSLNDCLFTCKFEQVVKNIQNLARCRDSRMEKVKKEGRDDHTKQASIQPPTRTFLYKTCIIESVDSICRDSGHTIYANTKKI